MFRKSKSGMVMSAVAAVLSIGSIGSAFAATSTTTQTATAHKVVMNGWKAEKGVHAGKLDNAQLLALLKLDADQLKEQLKAGKSLADVASAQGVATDEVVKLLTAERTKALDEAVASGKLTQEKADQAKEKLSDKIEKMVVSKHDGVQLGDHGHGRGFSKGFVNNAELLALLKLDANQLHEQLKAGKSLAEIAQAQGVSTDALTSLLAKQRDQKLAEAVKNGKLTIEQADRIKANSAQRIKQFIESKHDGRMHGKGFGLRNNAELLALLKLDADQLKEQLKAGKSLAEVAQAQGVTKDDVVKLLIAQRTKTLDEAVASGELTQEKANQIKSELADRINRFVEKKFDRKDGRKKEMQKASTQE
ncbi:hypothetical protein ACTID9_22435 [Brevibacillus fluminis]|uniref:hypothetical protein n=1 Tax=Brevibacillus fluminis TaxID=511487 RepID=UPI003F89D5D8